MLAANNISYAINGKMLLNDVSVAFNKGRLNLIIGPNGAGKSTLVKVISHQLKPKRGEVMYGGQNVAGLSTIALARMRAVLSQNIDIVFPLTVREVVLMGRYPHFSGSPQAADIAACDEAMEFFGVSHMADRDYMTLSGGEKQRTHFARVAAQIWYPQKSSPRFLILDEPLTYLDIYYQFDFMEKIKTLISKSDLVVVGVVHDLNLAARYGDHITILHDGKLLASGAKEDVLTKENIKTAFNIDTVIKEENGSLQVWFK